MLEANRFWFYSLVFSIILGLLQFFESQEADQASRKSSEKSNDSKAGDQRASHSVRSKSVEGVRRRLVSDCFDLLIPGHVTGWISTSIAMVGFATGVSTILSAKDIWDRLKE
jgi:hypothetical protein